jgi:uncharacterized protein (TIRG00374 family)
MDKTMSDSELVEEKPGEEQSVIPSSVSRGGFKNWHLWLGILSSLAFLALTFNGVNLTETARALGRVNIWILIAAVASFVLSIAFKAVRWQLLLSVRKAPSFGRAFSILTIGQMVNSFLPAHLGEFVRAYLMGEAEADSKIYVLGTVVVERVLDLLLLSISLLVLLSQMQLPDWLVISSRDTIWIIVILIPCFLLLAWQKNFTLRVVEWASRIVPAGWREWILRQARFGLTSLEVVRRPQLMAGLLGMSVIICINSVFTNYLVMLALGISLPIWASLLLLVVLQVGTVVPSSPGRIGVFQYLTILALSVFFVDKNLAFVYSLLLYLAAYLPTGPIGIFCLWREKVTWNTLDEAVAGIKRLRNMSK